MKIQVKRLSDGKIFTNDMSIENKFCILRIDFCTSYSQVEIQEEMQEEITGKTVFIATELITLPIGTKPSLLDMIAVHSGFTGEFTNE